MHNVFLVKTIKQAVFIILTTSKSRLRENKTVLYSILFKSENIYITHIMGHWLSSVSNFSALSRLQINLDRIDRMDRIDHFGVGARGVKHYEKLNFEHGSKNNYCPVTKVYIFSLGGAGGGGL